MPTTLSHSTSLLLIEPQETRAQHFRDVLATTLPQLPNVQVAHSLHEGLTIVRSHEISLVLIDMDLPDSPGPGAIRTVRATSPSSALVAFVETGKPEALLEAVHAGAHEILHDVLPSSETLVLAIRTALIRFQSRNTSEAVSSSSFHVQVPIPLLTKITHDLNNALTSINGFTDVLLARLPREEAPHRCAAQIKEASDRATSLVKELADMLPSPLPANHRTGPTSIF